MIKGLDTLEHASDFRSRLDHRKFGLGIGASELKFQAPLALKNLLPEEFAGTGRELDSEGIGATVFE